MRYILLLMLIQFSCKPVTTVVVKETQGLRIDHVPAMTPDSNVHVLIEISAGSTEKWEYDKINHELSRDSLDNQPRSINYLGYPANYGMIPHTLSHKEEGGDGDALDVIVLGPQLENGTIQECKLIGVLMLKDRGETDDKLLAIHVNSPMNQYSSLEEINQHYPGLLDIIETWFVNYKGQDDGGQSLMMSEGFHDREKAMSIIRAGLK